MRGPGTIPAGEGCGEFRLVEGILRGGLAAGAHRHLQEICDTRVGEALLYAYKYVKQITWILNQLLCGLGQCMQDSMQAMDLATDPSQCGREAGRLKRPRLRRQSIMDLPQSAARNSFRAAAAGRALGLNVLSHRAWVDGHYVRQYIIAQRVSMPRNLSFGFVRDATDGLLAGCFVGYETGDVCWAPCQA